MNRVVLVLLFSSLCVRGGLCGQDSADAGPAVTPQPRLVEWWFARHAEKIGAMSEDGVELLMLGDSITHNFESVGEPIWKQHFEPRKAVNLGFGGDRTNHLLWRLEHLPRLKKAPKAAVVLIGTNNICWGSDTPTQEEREPRYLMTVFGKLGKTMGSKNKDKARILSGPKAVKLKRGQAPGKVWRIALGKHRFKVSIEDVTGMDIKDALKPMERVPPLYRRCFEIVSEKDKDGVAFYKDLGGAAAHGGQQYLNIVPRAGASVMVHEAGHIMEQRARNTEKDILERWKDAIAKDKVSISPYGDRVHHEDQAEFARVYAFCLAAGPEQLKKLKARSPQRYALWERMLKLAKARR